MEGQTPGALAAGAGKTPGEIYEFNVKLDPCCNLSKKGHRIRVDISSSNFPRFDVNPNTGEPLMAQR